MQPPAPALFAAFCCCLLVAPATATASSRPWRGTATEPERSLPSPPPTDTEETYGLRSDPTALHELNTSSAAARERRMLLTEPSSGNSTSPPRDTEPAARLFLPRRSLLSCLFSRDQSSKDDKDTDDVSAANLADLRYAVEVGAVQAARGQAAILQALSGVSDGIRAIPGPEEQICDLSGLDDIQELIAEGIGDLATKLDLLPVMAETIIHRLDAFPNSLETLAGGQTEICDKMAALDTKLDTIIGQLGGGGEPEGGGRPESTPPLCPGGGILADKCYLISSNTADFDSAQADCETMSGDLATMTAVNAEALYELVSTAAESSAWIGLQSDTSWHWKDGSTYGEFQNWVMGEPFAPDKCAYAFAHTSTQGDWNPSNCGACFNYICQYDPVPPFRA